MVRVRSLGSWSPKIHRRGLTRVGADPELGLRDPDLPGWPPPGQWDRAGFPGDRPSPPPRGHPKARKDDPSRKIVEQSPAGAGPWEVEAPPEPRGTARQEPRPPKPRSCETL